MSKEIEQSTAAANDVPDDAAAGDVSSPTTSVVVPESSAVEMKDDHEDFSFLGNSARRMARNPCKHFVVAFVVSIAVSAAGFYFGEFTVSADNTGWLSRGTPIADQTTQLLLLNRHDFELNGNPDLWKDLTTNIQVGFEGAEPEDDRRRQLQTTADLTNVQNETNVGSGFLGCDASS